MKLLECIATFLTLIGVFLVSEKILFEGWIINGFADILWAIWGYFKTAYWLIFLQIILFILACNGLVNA